jgi:hypothetical protein
LPTARASSIPAVTAGQMAEVDRLAVEEFDLLLIQMTVSRWRSDRSGP